MSRVLPILFNTDMVRAILDGRKTVTRRKIPIDVVNYCDIDTDGTLLSYENDCGDFIEPKKLCQYHPGDILYVRETWKCWRAHRYEATADIMFRAGGDGVQLQFANGSTDSVNRFDYDAFVNKYFSHDGEWKPSLFMPKEAARIWLKVKDVRVERLQEITPQEAWKEGAICSCMSPVQDCEGNKTAFIDIWNSTIKKSDLDRYGWDANPWVWVIEFERCEKPENI